MGAKIYYNDVSSLATITYTTQEAAFPWTNIQANGARSKGRSTGTVNQDVIFDYGAAKALEGMTWHGSNLATGDTAKWRSGTTSGTADSNEDLTEDTKGHITSTLNKQFYAIRATMNALSYFEMGKMGLWGDVYELPISWIWGRRAGGYGDGDLNVSTINRGSNGSINKSELIYTKQLYSGLYIPSMTDAQNLIMRAILKTRYISFYDHVKQEIFFGILSASAEDMKKIYFGSNDITLNFEEAL